MFEGAGPVVVTLIAKCPCEWPSICCHKLDLVVTQSLLGQRELDFAGWWHSYGLRVGIRKRNLLWRSHSLCGGWVVGRGLCCEEFTCCLGGWIVGRGLCCEEFTCCFGGWVVERGICCKEVTCCLGGWVVGRGHCCEEFTCCLGQWDRLVPEEGVLQADDLLVLCGWL